MLQRIREALACDARACRERSMRADVQQRLRQLTPREQDLLPLLLEGLSNKHIARSLGLSPRTVETHRANLLKKMRVDSVTVLAQQLAGVTLPHS
jgi:FixJ family two-component response regulator